MRFHLLGLAHLPTTREYQSCAFTQKIHKLARMLTASGHHVTLYGAAGSDAPCAEFVEVVPQDVYHRVYGDYDWKREQFRYDTSDFAHVTFDRNAIDGINARKQPGDVLLCSMGTHHKAVADGVKMPLTVESGIGYSGVFAPFKVFESYAWMHHCYGRLGINDGAWYDCVIPNYFDPADYTYREIKGDYFLYLGRVVQRKGIHVAVEACQRLGAKLIVAGQPSGEAVDLSAPHVEYVGYADLETRRELLANARALFAPTIYIEPFGGVAVEAMLSGTPVITSDWGAFPETVLHGVTGYRCRTLGEFVDAARDIPRLEPAACRRWADANYGMSRVAELYDSYFTRLAQLRGDGWYSSAPADSLESLRKHYPSEVLDDD